MPNRFSKLAYKGRLLAIAAALLFILYGAAFLWFYTPYGGPYFLWRPDAQLIIQESPHDARLKQGDQVLAINRQSPVRMRPIYPLPLQTEYTLTIERENTISTLTIPVWATLNANIVRSFLPATVLSLAGWLVGAIILFLARWDNRDALTAGYTFLLSAVVLMGIQASLEGTPGAWVGGHCGIYLLAAAWVYLGVVPRAEPLTSRWRNIFYGLFAGAISLSLAAAYEVLFLFPQQISFQDVMGVSLYSLGFLLSAIGLLACVVIILLRWWRLPKKNYLRQQLLLLLIFIGIGTLPTMLLTVIPRALWDVTPLPFPIAISLMLFIPLGYLFVIYRKGFLGLDIVFSRIIHLTLLALLVFGFYVGGLYLVQAWLQLPAQEAVLPATIIFFPTLLVALYASEPVGRFVQQAVYGNIVLTQEKLAELALALSMRPELATLEQMVTAVAEMFDVSHSFLALTNGTGQLMPVGNVSTYAASLPANMKKLQRPLLRSRPQDARNSIFETVSWAELILPVQVRHELIGVLLLSRPGEQGYFNARQLQFLRQAAGVLAVGSENITLFEATLKLSRERLSFQEQERKKLSQQIHDDPLQQITYATTMVDQLVHRGEVIQQAGDPLPTVAVHLRQAAGTLREICVGLYPPMQDQGVELAVQEIVVQFRGKYGLKTDFSLPKKPVPQIDEQVVTAVCRILTEALNNIVKHAPAATATVALECNNEELTLTIADDGPGNPLAESSFSELVRHGHLGIVGMYEWAKLVNGRLQLTTNQPTGSRLLFTCPLNHDNKIKISVWRLSDDNTIG